MNCAGNTRLKHGLFLEMSVLFLSRVLNSLHNTEVFPCDKLFSIATSPIFALTPIYSRSECSEALRFLKVARYENQRHCLNQEIIKVREWIPHRVPLTKVIPLKLFLDMVPSFSEDFTRAMRGQPKQLSRNYRRRNGRNAIKYVFCTLSCLLFGFTFVCLLLVWLFIIWPFTRF